MAGRGYPSDLTDEQWALVEPLLPPARVGPKGGRREKHPRRRIVDAIFYVVRTGRAWRQLPKDFAPWPTVYWYFSWWHDDGTVARIHDALQRQVRAADGRNAEPSAGLIDSQSIRTADTVPAATRGFDAGKKVKGRKRFIVTDTLGLLLTVHVVAANTQDRDGARHPPVVDPSRPTGRPEGLGRPGLRRPPGRLGRTDPRSRAGDRPQGPRPARLPSPTKEVGGGTHLLVAHRTPTPGQGLRSQPGPIGDHDSLGDDRHHAPPTHPARPGEAFRPRPLCRVTTEPGQPAS